MKPYYEHAGVTIYHGDCREVLPHVEPVDLLLTDPPYPNSTGLFDDSIDAAIEVLPLIRCDQLMTFWSEVQHPPVGPWALVAVYIWHRTNVNGKIYEPIYHYTKDGEKKRSNIFRSAAIFDGVGPGCEEYLGHPTQKPVSLMKWCIEQYRFGDLPIMILDPFMGSGSTLIAAKDFGCKAIGIEIEERYCEIAAKRLSQEVFDFEARK